MSSQTLELLRQAFESNAINEIELLEISSGFVVMKIRLDDRLYEFRISESENVMRLVFNYMDFQASLEGKAIQLERIWNHFAFEHSLVTKLLLNDEEGLMVSVDFQHSPLLADQLWEAALSSAGLYVVKTFKSNFDYARHIVLAALDA